MAIRDTMATKAAPYLQPGEQIQAVFGGQRISQYWLLLSALIALFAQQYRVVAATDRRIIVFRGGRWTQTGIKAIHAEVPRATQIGPASGLWWKCESLGDPLYVHKRFHKDVLAADTALMSMPPQSTPPQSMPPQSMPPQSMPPQSMPPTSAPPA